MINSEHAPFLTKQSARKMVPKTTSRMKKYSQLTRILDACAADATHTDVSEETVKTARCFP